MYGQTNQNSGRFISAFAQKRKSSQSQGLGSPTIRLISQHMAIVSTVGAIEDSICYPGDSLRLGVESEGDLLLVKATHPSMVVLYPQPLFARRYGEYVILNTPHQPTIDMKKWTLVGAIKGIERRLSSNSALGQSNWYIKVHGVEGVLVKDWVDYIESKALPPEYLAELALEISAIDGASIQAAWSRSALDHAIIPTPNSIVFSFNRLETTSGFVSSWAAATKRTLRRKRRVRRQLDFDQALHPVPECRTWMNNITVGLDSQSDCSLQSSLGRGQLAGK